MNSLPPELKEATPNHKAWVWASWVVILLAVGTIIGSRFWMQSSADGPASKQMVILELQGRVLVGQQQLLGPLVPNVYQEAMKINRGNVEQRLRVIALAGEIAGATEAFQLLQSLDEARRKADVPISEKQKRVHDILEKLYHEQVAGRHPQLSLDPAERAFLVDELGWFGELALHPAARLPAAVERSAPMSGAAVAIALRTLPDPPGRTEALAPAKKTAAVLLSATSVAITAALFGFCGAITFAVFALTCMVSWRITTGLTRGGVYAETFALWLVLFGGMNVGAALLNLPRLGQALVTMPLSLAVLAWPIVRGISWRQLREDIGLTCERHPLVEIAAGVWCYIINLPLVIVGLFIMIGLMRLQALWPTGAEGEPVEDFSPDSSMPSHPVVHYLADGDWSMLLQIFVLASIMAPIVEETMFRGVLHRHCRELTSGSRAFVSALMSTTLVSFIFAAIHPQALVTIPVLMFMAFGFSLAREWRGSLLPSMFAHGMSNAAVLTVATIALSR